MKSTFLFTTLIVLACSQRVVAQHPPSIGYMFPPGGQVGQTVEVVLGGYDWTPDMQLFVHDPRVQLEILGPPGPVIVPEPPYWFGKKARRAPEPLPRELKARLTIPPHIPPGILKWQAANANGATATGRFVVSDITSIPETGSLAGSDTPVLPQQIETLPVCLSGQIKHIREVDRYRFKAERSEPITCSVTARAIGSQLNAVLEIRDRTGRLISDAADSAGNDLTLTFSATENEMYTAEIYDLDFRGDRSMVYQLNIRPGPRVVTAIPTSGHRGETRQVEFVGYGIATGQSKLESILRSVTFPADSASETFLYSLKTDYGECGPFPLRLSDETQQPDNGNLLTLPCGTTGVLDERFGEDRYRIAGKQGDRWSITVSTDVTALPVDAVLSLYDPEGKQLNRVDDQLDSTDAEMEFSVPTDGEYTVAVSGVGSHSGSRAATYYLSIRPVEPDYRLHLPELLNAPIGSKATLAVSVTRRGGFADAIDLMLTGLPAGVTAPETMQIPANQNALNVELNVAPDAAASGALISVAGNATIAGHPVGRTAGPVLIATTIKPPFSIDAEGQDDVTKWPRGTTFPAPVLISRDAGFEAEIVLEMTSRQGRHRQGISGPDLMVPPGVSRILYPIYLPEWLETTRTSRMVVNGVAKVIDPQGNERYSVSLQKTRMGFLPTGALLKISPETVEFRAMAGEQIRVPIIIDRSEKLTGTLTLELCCSEAQQAIFTAAPQTLTENVPQTEMSIAIAATAVSGSEHTLKIRATLLKDGLWPVISETSVLIELP